jgi:hypothetical protein
MKKLVVIAVLAGIGTRVDPGRPAEFSLEGRQLGQLLALSRDELAPEHHRLKVARADPATAKAWREQTTALDLPAVPAVPGHIPGEDRQKTQRRGWRIVLSAPAPEGPRGDATHRGGLLDTQAAEQLQRLQGGRIGREAFRQEFLIRPIGAGG